VIVVLRSGGVGAADDIDARRLDGVGLAHDEVEGGGLRLDRLLAVVVFAGVEQVVAVPGEVDDALLAQLAVGIVAVRVGAAGGERWRRRRRGGNARLARGGIGVFLLAQLLDPAIELDLLGGGALRVAAIVGIDPGLQRRAHGDDVLAILRRQRPARRILE